MRFSMIIVTAGSLMLSSPAICQTSSSTAPAAPEEDVIQPLEVPKGIHADSFCLATLTHYESTYDKIPEAVFDKMTETDRTDRRALGLSLKRSQSFYLGVVSTLRDDQLGPFYSAANKAFYHLSKDQQTNAFTACLQHILPRVARVGDAMSGDK